MEMHDTFFNIHVVISSAFTLIALVVIIWAIIGWVKKLERNRVFNRFSFFFIHLLYLQLITGVTLYFFLKPAESSSISLEEAMEHNSLRFWAIEHVAMMIFALLLAQTGRIMIKQLKIDYKIYRAATLYFGIAFIVVLSSMAMAFIK